MKVSLQCFHSCNSGAKDIEDQKEDAGSKNPFIHHSHTHHLCSEQYVSTGSRREGRTMSPFPHCSSATDLQPNKTFAFYRGESTPKKALTSNWPSENILIIIIMANPAVRGCSNLSDCILAPNTIQVVALLGHRWWWWWWCPTSIGVTTPDGYFLKVMAKSFLKVRVGGLANMSFYATVIQHKFWGSDKPNWTGT